MADRNGLSQRPIGHSRSQLLLLRRQIPRSPRRLVDPEEFDAAPVLRARRPRAAHERVAPVEHVRPLAPLGEGPVGVRPNRREVRAPREAVEQVREPLGRKPGQVELGESVAVRERVAHLPDLRQVGEPGDLGHLTIGVEPVRQVRVRKPRQVLGKRRLQHVHPGIVPGARPDRPVARRRAHPRAQRDLAPLLGLGIQRQHELAVGVITGSVGQVPSTSSSVPAQERAAPYARRASRAKAPWVTTIGSAQNPAEGGAQNTPAKPSAQSIDATAPATSPQGAISPPPVPSGARARAPRSSAGT